MTIFQWNTVVDLVELDTIDFDVILGIDWLYSYYDTIDCRTKKVIFHFYNESVLEWEGSPIVPKKRFIFIFEPEN